MPNTPDETIALSEECTQLGLTENERDDADESETGAQELTEEEIRDL